MHFPTWYEFGPLGSTLLGLGAILLGMTAMAVAHAIGAFSRGVLTDQKQVKRRDAKRVAARHVSEAKRLFRRNPQKLITESRGWPTTPSRLLAEALRLKSDFNFSAEDLGLRSDAELVELVRRGLHEDYIAEIIGTVGSSTTRRQARETKEAADERFDDADDSDACQFSENGLHGDFTAQQWQSADLLIPFSPPADAADGDEDSEGAKSTTQLPAADPSHPAEEALLADDYDGYLRNCAKMASSIPPPPSQDEK